MNRTVSLISAAALLLAGAFESARSGGDAALSAVMLTSGLILLGVWVAIEVWHHRDKEHGDD